MTEIPVTEPEKVVAGEELLKPPTAIKITMVINARSPSLILLLFDIALTPFPFPYTSLHVLIFLWAY